MKKTLFKRILSFALAWMMILPLGIFAENPFTVEAEAASLANILWPVSSNQINSKYGYRTFDNSNHNAVDIGACDNYDIKAAYEGVVYRYLNNCPHSDNYPNDKCGGNYIILEHNIGGTKYYSLYAHIRQNSTPIDFTKTGAKVKQGDVIGKVGSSGQSTGAHLHFAIFKNQPWKNPINTNPTDKRHNVTDSKGISYIYKSTQSTSPVAEKPTVTTSNYEGGVKVTIKSATSDAAVYYTTNGKTPTTSSTKLSNGGSFNLTSTKTVKAIAVKNGFVSSSLQSKKVTVTKVDTPKISSSVTSSGINITVTAAKGATVYYTTDGSAPTTSSTKYTGPFSVHENATVKAIAVAKGKAASSAASATVSASIPATPTVKLDSSSKNICGIGDNVAVTWSPVKDAFEYEAFLRRDGQDVAFLYTQSTIATFAMEKAGTYDITVKAVNFMGESDESSPAVSISVMPDVKVTFKDYDGTVIEEKTIKYGDSVTAPVPTKRTGYDFNAWDGKYNNVTADTVVTATYTPIPYTVIFVDENGEELCRETVDYGSAAANVPSAPSKTGYKFVAWSVKSGEGDSYTNVNGNVTFEPTYVWSNPDLPLGVAAQKAVRSADLKGYAVTVNISNSSNEIINGKIIAVIKTENDKVVATAIEAVAVPANAVDYTKTITINGTSDGMKAEVYVVANDPDNANRTGGAYSEKASVKVTREVSKTESYWGDWSEWSTTPITANDTTEVEVKTQYRYRDKQTTTSTSSSLSGWTQSGSSTSYGSWGSWSSWTTTKHTKSDTKSVETRKAYKYYHYCNGSNGIAPSTEYAYGKYGPHYYYSTTKKISAYCDVTGLPLSYNQGKCQKGVNFYYYGGEVTQYRYKTRTKTVTYSFWKWGDYSDWSDTAVTATDTRDVETRVVYRYRNLLERESTGSSDYIATENLSGTSYTIDGSLSNITTDYSGKIATVMVYKDRNTDPTESQIEYIGQITLGEENSYSFTFIPKEEISEETGNYVVSFGIATANGLINNVEIIEAPKSSYKVDFYDVDGNLLESQNVEKGESATAPVTVEQEGYETRWNRTFTNIESATTIKAEAIPQTYTLVFVDWANDKIVKMTEAQYGEKIEFPADCSATGKKFTGWNVEENATVTGNMVIEAVYEDIIFTVTFLNQDGSIYTTQTVSYGNAVLLPTENPVAEGYEFVAWSNNSNWWNVTEDITVEPIFIFDKTVETPMVTAAEEESVNFARIELETSTEGAEIRYTTDGSEPTEESVLFEDVIFVEETTQIKAKAFKFGMNSSATVENTVEVISEEEYATKQPKVSCVTSSYHEVGSDYVKICMKIENPSEYAVASWGYILTDLNTNESQEYENTEIAGIADKTIGRVFTVNNLSSDTEYSYQFFVVFEEHGDYLSGESTFRTSTNSDFSIRTPSRTTVKYGDGIILHADFSGTLAEGYRIVWEADNENFSMVVSENGKKCEVSPQKSGETTITAKIVDSNENVIASDTQVMTAKAGFFDKLIAFFKMIFGIGGTVYQQTIDLYK